MVVALAASCEVPNEQVDGIIKVLSYMSNKTINNMLALY